ncbi:VanW family protein [Paenibacillus sp. MSJ-34]|uniref:VanW family protein n=1 Tax=Paenibacillus sp. MSJ-34 TaxID=2841529 RepID=UPI00345FC197
MKLILKRVHYLFIVVAFVFLIVVGLWGWLHSYASQKTIPAGVRIANWEVGGLTAEQFVEKLNVYEERFANKQVVFTISEPKTKSETLTFKQLGVTFNKDELQSGILRLWEGNTWERVKYRHSMPLRFDLRVAWDASRIKSVFTPDWERRTMSDAVDAVRWITEDDEVRYVPEQLAYRIEWPELERNIAEILPADFTMFNDMNNSNKISLRVPLASTPPAITVASLKEEGIERKIVEFTTSFETSEEGRSHNVTSAALTIHDMILEPDEVFDYGKVIAETEKTYGFREAPVIYNGKLVPGIGGGICQVSSTLYKAALLSGLEIVERRNHSLPVSYLPIGQDATFADGYINFRFKNSTGKSLLIRTSVENKRLTVKLFGTLPEDVTYEVKSETVKVLDPPVKYVRNTSLPAGKEQVLQAGKQGFVVDTYRIERKGGKVVDTKRVSRDTYQPQPKLVAVNAGGEGGSDGKKNDDSQRIVEDGIGGPNF